ncbi:MAG: 4Fe-4S binding protein, partial [Clostridia bacterium]|nr:4Fe-4S binding protein [Clostridia bacterium]
APNEKVAVETAIGASFGGARAFSAMKHVGLNVAADPVFTASYTGVNAGLIIAVADDPGMHSSQNEQDSRNHAISSKIPMLEPADSTECRDFVGIAYEISEKFDTPVFLRLSTRIAHSQSLVETGERRDIPLKPVDKNPRKYVMTPANAIPKHVTVEKRTEAVREWAENCAVNTVEENTADIGIIASGTCYQYAKEALAKKASYLKLGMVNPLPVKLIENFCKNHKKVYVVEELDPIIENYCKSLGLQVAGKELFPLCGEISASMVKEKILGETVEKGVSLPDLPVRPPVMCSGCPHRGMFYVLKKLGVFVNGDIGCYTLGAAAPLNAIDTTVCMGFSVSGLHGFLKANGETKKSVAVIGDSTFVHSGITGLINMAYNRSCGTVIVLDNSITGMTGHQQNPATGITLKGDMTTAVDLEALCKAVGINRVRVVDPQEIDVVEKAVREELEADEPSVIIARRPCVMIKKAVINPPYRIDPEKCKKCKMCMKIGCPSLSVNPENGTVRVDATLCVGCGLCKKLCKFGAISEN